MLTTRRTALRFLALPLAANSRAQTRPEAERDVLDHFLRLSDVAASALVPEPPDNKNHRKVPNIREHPAFFVDSYAVRALAVAYDLTGRERYWEACRVWTDRMLRHQEKMIPAGAYYMNYERKPGESQGQWFVADCGSIAMAVLAAAARAPEQGVRRRYLESVRSFLRLVMDRFVRPSGGVTDGYWKGSDKEWWCSTALFGAAALQYYGLAGGEEYREAGLATIEWLLRFEYSGTILYTFENGAPTTIFYILEDYFSALPFLPADGEIRRRVHAKLAQTVEWIAATQTREGTWNYNPNNWGVKLGGFPAHLFMYLRRAPAGGARQRPAIGFTGDTIPFERHVENCARRALAHFTSFAPDPARFTQREAFVLLSEAEFLCPGELYQKSQAAFPYPRVAL